MAGRLFSSHLFIMGPKCRLRCWRLGNRGRDPVIPFKEPNMSPLSYETKSSHFTCELNHIPSHTDKTRVQHYSSHTRGKSTSEWTSPLRRTNPYVLVMRLNLWSCQESRLFQFHGATATSPLHIARPVGTAGSSGWVERLIYSADRTVTSDLRKLAVREFGTPESIQDKRVLETNQTNKLIRPWNSEGWPVVVLERPTRFWSQFQLTHAIGTCATSHSIPEELNRSNCFHAISGWTGKAAGEEFHG